MADPKLSNRVALLGFGTVGSAVAQLLHARAFPDIILAAIANRDVDRKRRSGRAIPLSTEITWHDTPTRILADPSISVVIETIGGLGEVEQWVRAALSAGKSVVTANKQLIAYRGAELSALAAEHGAQLLFNAAVAGGVPVVPAVLQGLGGDRISRLAGILNGTCNFILSRMELGQEYAHVLAAAQRAGYAEADPAADVDGLDARAKLCILARVALHVELSPDDISTQSIADLDAIDFQYARELSCTIRQISRMELDGETVRARVAPMLVPHSSPIAWSHGTQNMVVTTGEFGGDVVFSGHGAGGNPTAVAIVSDLLAIAHGSAAVSLPAMARPIAGEFFAPHYLRFIVSDKPGIVSAISGALASVGANIDSILQRPGYPKERLPFVVTTEPSLTSTIDRALAIMGNFDCMLRQPLALQIVTSNDQAED